MEEEIYPFWAALRNKKFTNLPDKLFRGKKGRGPFHAPFPVKTEKIWRNKPDLERDGSGMRKEFRGKKVSISLSNSTKSWYRTRIQSKRVAKDRIYTCMFTCYYFSAWFDNRPFHIMQIKFSRNLYPCCGDINTTTIAIPWGFFIQCFLHYPPQLRGG